MIKKKNQSREVRLRFPITVETEKEQTITIEVVKVDRLKVKHICSLPKELSEKLAAIGEGEKVNITIAESVPLLLQVTNLTEEQIQELDLTDFSKIQEVIGSDDF